MRTMRTYITYDGEIIEAIILGSNKVSISQKDFFIDGQIDGSHRIELDQCQECGEWCCEDEDMYHDNIDDKQYCDSCSVLCESCSCCFHRSNMSPDPEDDDMLCCNHCLGKIDRFQKVIDDFDDVEVQDGDVKVVFTYIGEGMSGDYREVGVEDVPLFRFDIFKKDYVDFDGGIDHPDWNWGEVDGGSYCTTVTIDTPKEIVEKMALHILNEVKHSIMTGESIRSIAADMSHIGSMDVV